MSYIFNLIAIIVSLRLWKGSIHNSAEKRNSLINCIFVACGCLSTVPRELLSVPIRDVLVLYLIEKIIIVGAQCAVIHLQGGIGICLIA
jgi:hypothetical protein